MPLKVTIKEVEARIQADRLWFFLQEGIAEFIVNRTGLEVAELEEPSVWKHVGPYWTYIQYGLVLLSIGIVYHVLNAHWPRNPLLWMLGTIVVYCFAVSGGAVLSLKENWFVQMLFVTFFHTHAQFCVPIQSIPSGIIHVSVDTWCGKGHV